MLYCILNAVRGDNFEEYSIGPIAYITNYYNIKNYFMEKKTVRQFSLLGLVLMGASALTAAIVPSKAAPLQANSADNGTLRQFSGGDNANQVIVSCVVLPQQVLKCHVTVGTGTTGGAVATIIITINGHSYQTVGNTSQSNSLNAQDTTSVLQQI